MSDLLNASPQQKVIASVTLRLVENRDGVRYCDTVSSLDESKLTPYDAAKFQFHCFHWFAALHEIVIRLLVNRDDALAQSLQNQADQLRRIQEGLQAQQGAQPKG